MAEIARAAAPLRLGSEGPTILTVHRSSSPLYVHGVAYPPGTPLEIHEWGTFPIETLIANPPAGLLVQGRRDGVKLRWRIGTKPWRHASGTRPHMIINANGIRVRIGRLRYKIKEQSIRASQLMAGAFMGPAPPQKTYALHVNRVSDDAPSDDNVINVCWGSRRDNAADKIIDDTAGNNGRGTKLAIYGRPATNERLPDVKGIVFDVEGATGLLWATFESLTEAQARTGAEIAAISTVLDGSRKLAGGWWWAWVNVEPPAAADMAFIDTSQRGRRFVTRDGRVLLEKVTASGAVFVEVPITPMLTGYCSIGSGVGGDTHAPLHRVIAWSFMRDECDEKTRTSGLDFARLQVHHIDGNKSNNAVSNLQIVTPREHGVITHGRAVIETAGPSPESGRVAFFATGTDAAKSANVPQSSFSCRLKRTGSTTIKYEDFTERHFHLENRGTRANAAPAIYRRTIVETCEALPSSSRIAAYDTLTLASTAAGMSIQTLHGRLKKTGSTTIKYEDDTERHFHCVSAITASKTLAANANLDDGTEDESV